jgi:hypothetical protein
MIKLINFIGKFIASIIVLLFIIFTLASIFLLSFENQLLSPDFYLQVLEDEDFFDQLPEIAAVQIQYSMVSITSSSEGGPPSYFQALSEKDWELLLTGLLPDNWLEDQINNMFGDLSDTIDTGEGNIKLSISMLELKEHLGGEAGVEAIAQLLDAQPECSKDDLLEMTRILEGKEDPGKDFLTCKPPDDFIKNYTPQLGVILRRSIRDIPDEIDLGKGLLMDNGTIGSIKAFGIELPTYLFIKWIRWGIRMSPLFAVTLLLLIALLAVHSIKALGVWWGYPLAISGLIGFTIAMLVGPLANWATNSFLDDRTMAGFSPILVETGGGLAVQVLRLIFIQVRNISLITAGAGFAVIILSAVFQSPGKKESDQVDEANKEEPDINQADPVDSKETEQETPEDIEKEPEPEELEPEKSEPEEPEPEETEQEAPEDIEKDPEIGDPGAK